MYVRGCRTVGLLVDMRDDNIKVATKSQLQRILKTTLLHRMSAVWYRLFVFSYATLTAHRCT